MTHTKLADHELNPSLCSTILWSQKSAISSSRDQQAKAGGDQVAQSFDPLRRPMVYEGS
jgi:hypothetical protein